MSGAISAAAIITVPVSEPTCPFFDQLRTPSEVETFFRLRRHTALHAVRAGLIPGARRSRCGRESFLIDPRDAYKFWGPQ